MIFFMKKTLFTLVLLLLFVVTTVGQQGNSQKSNTLGTWKFEAPYAPEGYTTGTILLGQEAQKHTASMSFTGSEYKLPGEKVKVTNDSILFSVYLEGQDIKVLLKIENESKMSGKAVYSEGEVPLTLTKEVALNK
jgi:hypothetical protein